MSGRGSPREGEVPVRPHLRELEPYTTARSQHTGGVLLDANENGFGPPDPEADASLGRYPDPRTPALRSRLARRLDLPPDSLWLGNGSDDGIDALLRAVVEPGEEVAVPAPTYGVYRSRALAHGARPRRFPLAEDFGLDPEAALRAGRAASLLFLCTPNNPTGGVLDPAAVVDLADRLERCVVAVDEAYVEFSSARSLAGEAASRPDLVVLRTFSKAWGLAGARVGYAVGAPGTVEYLRRVSLPYPLSRPAARAAVRALEHAEEMERRVERIRGERARVRSRLEELELDPLPSEANFLLFFVPDPRRVQRRLAEEHGVVVRDRSGLERLSGGLRVTVGTPGENDRFLRALDAVLEGGRQGGRPCR